MPIGDAELKDAWNKVLDRFPFPDYIKTPRNQVDVARQVSRFLPPGSRVLDFGAGPADKTGVVAVVGYDVWAMDDLQDSWHKKPESRRAILDYARDIGITYLPITNGELPATDGEFDMVMSHDVVEHLHDPPRYLLNDLMQRVRTGGYLYLTVPNAVNIRKRIAVLRGKTNHPVWPVYYWSPVPFRGHLREYTKDDCIGLAKALGLEIIEVKGWHQGVEGRVPKGLRRLYLAFSALAPGTRDSWRLIARKPEGWTPKLELTEEEMLSYTGLTCWDDLGH